MLINVNVSSTLILFSIVPNPILIAEDDTIHSRSNNDSMTHAISGTQQTQKYLTVT